MLYTEEYVYRRFHNLITDFIIHMNSKVKEMRIKADETARTMQVYAREGLDPPAKLQRHFEEFLLLIAKFYRKDPLKLQLMLEYWSPLEAPTYHSYSLSESMRSVSLFKFVRLAGETLPPTLFVPYTDMLASLANCQQAARYCFNMLKQTTPGCNVSITWDHFFMSFNQYYNNLRQEMPPISDTVYAQKVYHKGMYISIFYIMYVELELNLNKILMPRNNLNSKT